MYCTTQMFFEWTMNMPSAQHLRKYLPLTCTLWAGRFARWVLVRLQVCFIFKKKSINFQILIGLVHCHQNKIHNWPQRQQCLAVDKNASIHSWKAPHHRQKIHRQKIKTWFWLNLQNGTWIEVEMDTPMGKTGGSVQNNQYFQCNPKHGIFIRGDNLNQDKRDRAMLMVSFWGFEYIIHSVDRINKKKKSKYNFHHSLVYTIPKCINFWNLFRFCVFFLQQHCNLVDRCPQCIVYSNLNGRLRV